MTRNRTPHVTAKWVYARDVAEALGCSMPTARLVLRLVPGAELAYKTDVGRQRWHAPREAWQKYLRRIDWAILALKRLGIPERAISSFARKRAV